MMFSEMFLENMSDEIDYQGKLITRYYKFTEKGAYKFKFNFISKDSNYGQSIEFLIENFVGDIFYNGKKMKKPRGKFPSIMHEIKNPPEYFEVDVVLQDGDLTICNGYSRPNLPGIWGYLYGGCAMHKVDLGENHYRFYCNDYEDDDDFDDLIFELEIIKVEEAQ